MGLVALRHVGFSWTRDWTRVPCVGRRIVNCLASPGKSLCSIFKIVYFWHRAGTDRYLLSECMNCRVQESARTCVPSQDSPCLLFAVLPPWGSPFWTRWDLAELFSPRYRIQSPQTKSHWPVSVPRPCLNQWLRLDRWNMPIGLLGSHACPWFTEIGEAGWFQRKLGVFLPDLGDDCSIAILTCAHFILLKIPPKERWKN